MGEWVYNVKGRGTEPSRVDIITVSTPLNYRHSDNVQFTNPFDQPVNVSISMENPTASDTYALHLKKRSHTIPAGATFQIPYTFFPRSMTESTCHLIVESLDAFPPSNQHLRWLYLIKGIAEAPSSEEVIELKTRARKRLEKVVELHLAGLGSSASSEEFTFEVMVPDSSPVASFLRRCLQFHLRNPIVSDGAEPLVFDVVFEPLKQVTRQTVELVVSKKSGGRWRFQVQVEALEPEVDDIIRIHSQIHKTSSVSFRLTNQFDSYAEFQAYFTRDSSIEFTVSPKSGVLPPYGHEGTPFVVSFTPHEYGKNLVGKLIIVSEDMQWTYEVRGTHPKFEKPMVSASIDDRLSSEVLNKLHSAAAASRSKDFLRANAKNIKQLQSSGTPKK